jgi:hypothetical protein
MAGKVERKRSWTGTFALASAAAALLAVATPAIAGSSTVAGHVPACATRSLVIWLDTTGDAGAGGVRFELELTNVSAHSCALTGYPGISAVDLAGRGIGSPAGRNAGAPVKTIVLAPGATASSALRIAATGVFPASSCRATTAAGLRVYPPNQTTSKIVPYPFGACSKAGATYLQVQAVTSMKRP